MKKTFYQSTTQALLLHNVMQQTANSFYYIFVLDLILILFATIIIKHYYYYYNVIYYLFGDPKLFTPNVFNIVTHVASSPCLLLARVQVSMKGHVAAEISAGDELVVAELLFSGALLEATPEQCASVLSCVVWQEKSAASAKVSRMYFA